MPLKQTVFEYCLQVVEAKIKALQHTLQDLAEGTLNDSKSSAGDKHETARAMMQLEQEKISKQLDEAFMQKNALQKIDISATSGQIKAGSLISTNKGYLFLGIALGKIIVEEKEIIVLSPESPLGVKLLGLYATAFTEVNGNRFVIEEVF